ncbi:ROK family transcriptional regulator [Cellulosimicrobium funkei]|uniref:ROK family transcriptional regulator n=1 Tax=Cellulosimicrobium funkei TaxID=264251 RepID=A0A4Y8R685_9MICO|nr:ROK family transcriptional regulator [Cellulosimicrobium funkei]TFF17122.1 ROK family transcriptional regulator [Cellulosimicrobium funkei]TGA70980.1 ROK family transcriptional regulator [Cellulosimicrobium terreum]
MDTTPAGTPALLRTLNARAVLDVLGTGAQVARPDVVAATGLSKTTVAQTLRALEATGVVTEAGLDRDRRGPAATLYRVDPDYAFGLGIDVARDRVRVALVDVTGAVRARAERRDVRPTPTARARAAAELARACVTDVEARLPEGASVEVTRAVAAVPSIVSPDHATIRRVPGFEKGGTDLHDALVDALGCPVTLENDLNLAALAEQRDGVAAGVRTFVVLGLGDGFGAGLVLDGRLHRGAAGGAGEVSFLPHPGRSLGSETLGASSIAAIAKENGLPDDIAVKDIVDRAAQGDGASGDVLDEVAERIGVVAAAVALVVEPELFVLTNHAARPPIAERVQRFLGEKLAVLPVRVVPSELTSDAVVVGAARSASDALRDEVFRAAAAHSAPGESGEADDEHAEAAS